jgi:hypothetical protein
LVKRLQLHSFPFSAWFRTGSQQEDYNLTNEARSNRSMELALTLWVDTCVSQSPLAPYEKSQIRLSTNLHEEVLWLRSRVGPLLTQTSFFPRESPIWNLRPSFAIGKLWAQLID